MWHCPNILIFTYFQFLKLNSYSIKFIGFSRKLFIKLFASSSDLSVFVKNTFLPSICIHNIHLPLLFFATNCISLSIFLLLKKF
ncbi:hypothetical protein CKR_1356 [Clostridium kluyveri NBRC 12016]|uniref:Uncharacterized protein n=1 Tax=Clostridium kluyveri (strain NBRC 12016) TaxID=583346 RepID=B9E1N2_CLOK1|nr:hypothetical protein CKR_1356 [Clostridium kluyveri NBRC 12016]